MSSHLEALHSWHGEYMSAEGSKLCLDSDVVKIVNTDSLDEGVVESLVHEAIAKSDVCAGFCQNCRHLFEQWPDLGTKIWRYSAGRAFEIHEIAAAAKLGCQFCAFLLTRMKAEKSLDTFLKLVRRLQLLKESTEMILSVQNWANGEAQLIWLNLPGKESKHCNDRGSYALKLESHVVEADSYLSLRNLQPLEIARSWLENCTKSHQDCRIKGTFDRPSRLVLIQDECIKVVHTNQWSSMPKYATLSYCWGKRDFVKLRLDNMDLLQEGISREKLPATFKDAVHITQELGIEYIWIDAFCIIQNDVNDTDWKRESGLMRSVYGGSFINIAASSATDVHGGCFLKPDDHNHGFCALVHISGTKRMQSFHFAGIHEESTGDTHLATRAWAFQERLLPARTIHTGEHGLYWECRTCVSSEFFPKGIPWQLGSDMVIREGEHWNWDNIVDEYARASLTNAMDKLPALSGIARRQHEVTGHQYLAGMWREDLVLQLAWQPQPERRCKRPALRAPSWSWASIDGALSRSSWPSQYRPDLVEDIQILNVMVQPSGHDPFGMVTGGEITMAISLLIRGKLCDYPIRKTPDLQGVAIDHTRKQFPILFDCVDDEVAKDVVIYLLPILRGTSSRFGVVKADGAGDDTGDRNDNHDTKEHNNIGEAGQNSGAAEDDSGGAVNLHNGENENASDEDDMDSLADYDMRKEVGIFGLVMQRHGSLKGHFCRVGSFTYLHCDHEDPYEGADYSNYHPFLQVLDEVGTSVVEEECAAVNENAGQPGKEFVMVLE